MMSRLPANKWSCRSFKQYNRIWGLQIWCICLPLTKLYLRSSIMPIRTVTASAVPLRALTMSRTWASMSSNSLNFLSKARVKPVVWSSLARSVRALVLVARSWTMRSQSPKHWWQGLQSGKVPEKPRAHWSQRTPDTPCWHTQWPVTRLHWDDSMPRGSQSHAVGGEVTKSIGFWWIMINCEAKMF